MPSTPSIIRVLDDTTINQIAAGEVVENPASVVKELIDNALDAGSTEITIEITSGGRQLIRVIDNGCGMGHDDALLAFERHATSKIGGIDDVSNLSTMGFRGEAVPSIASIAKCTLITCLEGDSHGDAGTMVIVDGGKIIKCCSAARSRGTTVEVKSLFFNVPVRKKFQRSPTYDTNEVQQVVGRLALANPRVRFHLISNQKTLLKAFADDPGQRISEVLGLDFFSALKPVCAENSDLDSGWKVSGFAGVPAYSRHNRTGQYLMINGRPVLCPAISFAVRDAYGTRLDTHRHPVFVLHLTIPPDSIDVNVHPQKREVRIRQMANLRTLLTMAIEQGLQGLQVSPIEHCEYKPEFSVAPSISLPAPAYVQSAPVPAPAPCSYYVEPPEPPASPNTTVLGAVGGYVLIKKVPATLLLMDQRAAHTRILYERFLSEDAPIETQSFLIPMTIDLTPDESPRLHEHLEELQKIGFDIAHFGQNTFAINGIPSCMKEGEVRGFIEKLVSDKDLSNSSDALQEQRRSRIALAAAQAAITRKQDLTHQEATDLYRQLMECNSPDECPRGKSVLFEVEIDELIRKINRCPQT